MRLLLIKFVFLIGLFSPAFSFGQTQTLPQGWSLVGNDSGSMIDPVLVFGNASTPTSLSSSVVTVWTWDNVRNRWSFFSPSMTPQELTAYATLKGYGVMDSIPKGQGFWVNAKSQFLYSPIPTSSSNPLKKYEGTYYICDSHSKKTVTVAATGSSSLSLAFVENIHKEQDCTGAIVGTYTLPQVVTATYQYQTTANLPPITILPDSAAVDQVTISSPSMTAKLTGTGVSGSCVNFNNGNVCFNSLANPASNKTGALYINGNYLITLSVTNGVLEADDIFSKDSSFNYNMMVLD